MRVSALSLKDMQALNHLQFGTTQAACLRLSHVTQISEIK